MIKVDAEEVCVWAGIDVETVQVVHVDVSPGRSSLDALLFLKTVMNRCRGKLLVNVDRGPWYNWALDLLNCDYEKETFGERSLSESVFGLFKYRILIF
jgi:putative transposase